VNTVIFKKVDRDVMKIVVSLNNRDVPLELDTGSSISIINEDTLRTIPNHCITASNKVAKDYGNNPIKIIGESRLSVRLNNRVVNHNFIVVDNKHVCLFGRDLCDKFNVKIAFQEGINVHSVAPLDKNSIFNKYSYFLSDSYKSCVKNKITLQVEGESGQMFFKPRSVPFRYRVLVKEELERLEKAGIITRVVSSDIASPIVAVLKSNGSVRICGDFSVTINKFIKRLICPMPTVEFVMSQVGNASVFTKIDLQNAYLQLPLDENSKRFTTINTQEGLFQYNYLPFGTSVSSQIFQSFISNVLTNVKGTIVYQDDILLMSSNETDHIKLLDEVLSRLQSAGVKINHNKCKYFTDKVTYLGYVFSKDGVYPASNKMDAIINCPYPKNVKEVQSFIGLCNYYSRFIKNFSTVFAPLYKLLQKNVQFKWCEEQKQCVDSVKEIFKRCSMLKLFNPSLPTAVEADASPYGIGGVLLQKHDEMWCPVQFASRSLSKVERSYAQIDKEALSVLFSCNRFREFLLGSKFTIRTDHKPLLKLLGSNELIPTNVSPRMQRWALRLAQFDYEITHIKGVDNLQADCLSRLPLPYTMTCSEPTEMILMVEHFEDTGLSCDAIREAAKKDNVLSSVKEYVINGWPHKVPAMFSPYVKRKDEFTIFNDCLLVGNKIVIPDAYKIKVLNCLHEGHPGIPAMKMLARSLCWYPGIDSNIEEYCKSCKTCALNHVKTNVNHQIEWPVPEKKWSRIHIDHFFVDDKICFIVVDALTKYIECEVVQSVGTNNTIEALRAIFARNGIPDAIVSDNATSFVSTEFLEFANSNNIKLFNPPPYTPRGNGLAERSVRTIKNLLNQIKLGSLKTRLSKCLLYYRTTPLSSTGISPCQALNGREYVTTKHRINPLFVPSSNIRVFNGRASRFKVGDPILAVNYHRGPKWLEGKITKQIGNSTYLVKLDINGIIWKRNADQLLDRKFVSENDRLNDNGSVNDELSKGAPKSVVCEIPLYKESERKETGMNGNKSSDQHKFQTANTRRSGRTSKQVQQHLNIEPRWAKPPTKKSTW
jgi:hypothetical protein